MIRRGCRMPNHANGRVALKNGRQAIQNALKNCIQKRQSPAGDRSGLDVARSARAKHKAQLV